MQPKTLSKFQALIFDVYGTLVDWESGIYKALQPLLRRANSSWTKQEALIAFSNAETDLQAQHPEMLYNELLAAVHNRIATRFEVESDQAEDEQFGRSIEHWPVFPDTVAALASLKKHFKLVVLSNVDNHSFNTYTRPLLEAQGGVFDLVLTAQDLKAYKPNPATFEAAVLALSNKFSIGREEVLVTAQSLTHDHAPANALGLHSAWIAREGALTCIDSDATYDFKFTTLGEMAEMREREETA